MDKIPVHLMGINEIWQHKNTGEYIEYSIPSIDFEHEDAICTDKDAFITITKIVEPIKLYKLNRVKEYKKISCYGLSRLQLKALHNGQHYELFFRGYEVKKLTEFMVTKSAPAEKDNTKKDYHYTAKRHKKHEKEVFEDYNPDTKEDIAD